MTSHLRLVVLGMSGTPDRRTNLSVSRRPRYFPVSRELRGNNMRSVLDLGSNGGRRYHRVAECGSPRQPPHRRTWLVVCCLSVGSLCSVLIQPAVAQAAPSVWSVTNSPNEGSGQDQLFDVSCVTSTFCMAVGYFYNVEFEKQTLVESLAGGTWSWDSSPSAGLDSYLYGVSCSSSTSCIAVGYYTKFIRRRPDLGRIVERE